MLTRRGTYALSAGVALMALWLLLGEIELAAAGTVLLGALGSAVFLRAWVRPRLTITRRIHPSRVQEGDQATVHLVVSNHSRRRLGSVTFIDRVGPLGDALFEAGAIPSSSRSVHARYQVLCRPRGVYEVGPVTVRVTDPLGLAFTGLETGPVDRLIVFPETEELEGFPITRGRDPAMNVSKPEFSQQGGEDFYTLREYRIGDDLRGVHWPSSAKRDELMIRQLETPWQSRALVLFDTRSASYERKDCFEKAVRGAASVVRHLARLGFDAEMWAGGSSPINISNYTAVMEQLALIQPLQRVDLRASAARLRQSGAGGALVMITGIPDHDLLEVHRLLNRDYRATILGAAADTAPSNEIAFQRLGAFTMTVAPSGSWAAAWRKMTERTWAGVSD